MKPGASVGDITLPNKKSFAVRAVDLSDVDRLLTFANAMVAEDTYIMLSGKPLTREYEESYVKDSVSKVLNDGKIHLLALDGNTVAASFEVRRFFFRKRHVGEIGISVAKPYRGMGLGSACMRVLIGEAKNAGLRLLVLSVFETNRTAIRMYENAGFSRAGTVPGVFAYRGDFVGDLTMYLPL